MTFKVYKLPISTTKCRKPTSSLCRLQVLMKPVKYRFYLFLLNICNVYYRELWLISHQNNLYVLDKIDNVNIKLANFRNLFSHFLYSLFFGEILHFIFGSIRWANN